MHTGRVQDMIQRKRLSTQKGSYNPLIAPESNDVNTKKIVSLFTAVHQLKAG